MAPNVPSSGCLGGNHEAKVGINNNTISGRSYLLSIPPRYSVWYPSPLIFSFHGGGQDATAQLNADLLTNSTINDQYVLIYPEAVDGQWEVSPDSDSDDIGFVSKILGHVESQLCIDESRIYATGKSQGGGLVGMLACDEDMSTKIAAFAPVSGAFYVKNKDGCDPDTVTIKCSPGRSDIPILEFHGGDDDVVPYDGLDDKRDACLPAIPHWAQTWAKQNNLSTSNISSDLTNEATMYQFGSGANLGLVSHVYDGGKVGHVWPISKDLANSSGSTASFDATPMILDFFGRYSLVASHTTVTSDGDVNGSSNGSSSGSKSSSGTSSSAGTQQAMGTVLPLSCFLFYLFWTVFGLGD
ncbi:putative feruloyl esterase [Seiridium unicorne]|uniref:feruloyl esterase n=1 Tax=Seiridium unicorne TaxID=138068 RepID=A0ABR2UEL0_9PEZI